MNHADITCDRRTFLHLGGVALGAAALGPAWTRCARADETAAPPNIIVILVDDMGWGDLSCQPQDATRPGTRIRTPNLDSLAAEGARCTQAYATCMVCAPSRAGLLTGRYQQRFGWYEFKECVAGLPADHLTLAETLKPRGCATACMGKWHLGYEPAQGPLTRGFDRFYGFLGGQHDYYDPRNGDPIHAFPHDLDAWVLDQETPVKEMDYLTDELTDQSLAFIDEQVEAKRPFLLYLAYNAPHPPMQATWENLEPYAEQRPGRFTERDLARAMIDSVDQNVGRLLDHLMHLGIDRNTLVVFSSDNGGHDDGPGGRALVQHNGGLRGRKGLYWEGGIRVPMILRWPGHIPEGTVYDLPVSQLDIYATALGAAGAARPPQPLDGVDLVPYLDGRRLERPHETLYWGLDGENRRWAVRRGDWKLTHDFVDTDTLYKKEYRMVTELHNLGRDPHETNNLIEQHPDVAAELQGLIDAFYAGCPDSLATPAMMAAWKKEYDRRLKARPNPNALRRDGAPGHWLQ